MLNKQQRAFRKQMKKAEKERKKSGVQEPLSFRFENEKPSPSKRNKSLWVSGGTLAFLIVSWNIYAASTWIQVDKDSNKEVLAVVNQAEGAKPEAIGNYLAKTKGLSNGISERLNKVSNKTTFDSISIEELKVLQKEMEKEKQKTNTKEEGLYPLRDFYLQQISLAQHLLEETINQKEDNSYHEIYRMNKLRNEYNQNIPNEQAIIFAIFDKSDIFYEVQKDGSLYYELSVRK